MPLMWVASCDDAKNHFGELIHAARAAPVVITKYDRPVVVTVAVEDYEVE
jgi:prevent-host-death family protein